MKKLVVALGIFVLSPFSTPLFLFVQHTDDGVRLIQTFSPLVSSLCIILLCILFDLPIREGNDNVNVILFWPFNTVFTLRTNVDSILLTRGPRLHFPRPNT